MSEHPEESLPGHNENVTTSDDSARRVGTLTVGALRTSLHGLSADTAVVVAVNPGELPRAAVYAHQSVNCHALIIAIAQVGS